MTKNYKRYLYIFLSLVVVVFALLTMLNMFPEVGIGKNEPLEQEYIVPSKYENIKVKTVEERDEERRYLLHTSWPVTENEEINEVLDKLADDFIKEYRATAAEVQKSREDYIAETGRDGATFHADYGMHFDVAFANKDYVAFVFDSYRNTGNTGTDEVSSLIFDRVSGERIPIEKLFARPNYLEDLSSLARERLYERAEEEADEADFDSSADRKEWTEGLKEGMIDPGTEPTEENFHSIVISEDGNLEIYFDKYQVAPGYWGVVKVEIPLEDISHLFSPEVKKIFNLTDKTVIKPKDEPPKEEPPQRPQPPVDSSSTACASNKCIALTFDDGPSVHTEALLNILKEKGVKATFFVLGSSAKVQQQTILDLSKAGMEIGNHTWSHRDLTKLTIEDIREEVNSTNDLVEAITGTRPYLVRPPYGAIDRQVESVVNLPLILWSIDPEDWKYHDSNYVAEHIINHAKSGAVVLSHDIHETTVAAMPRVIDSLLASGYQLVTVSELFGAENLMSGGVYRGR